MHLLQSGVPIITIKDVLGHADVKLTEIYVQTDLEAKRKALEQGGHIKGRSPFTEIAPISSHGSSPCDGIMESNTPTRHGSPVPSDALNITPDLP